MNKLKIKLLKLMIWLCDYALADTEGEEQCEINGFVAQRNDLMKKLKLAESKVK